jgi:hypothetical protein
MDIDPLRIHTKKILDLAPDSINMDTEHSCQEKKWRMGLSECYE